MFWPDLATFSSQVIDIVDMIFSFWESFSSSSSELTSCLLDSIFLSISTSALSSLITLAFWSSLTTA